jgi:NAD(P)-dependent dehydrogenase (short-subunit alcohol dehydrogenase family)
MENREPVVIVTGASSGLGNACATHLAKRGFRVYGTSRNPAAYTKKADEYFEMIAMNANDDQSAGKAIAAVLAKEGRVDALLCNAGMGIAGSVEDCGLDEIKLQMDTNFMGAVRAVKAVLPAMREAGKGKIIVISSIAGVMGMPFQAFYSSSKYALEGFIESLRFEMRPFGVEACLIEPGDFHTGFTAARKGAEAAAKGPYKAFYDTAMGIQIRDETSGHDPIEVAKLVQRLLDKKHLKTRYTVGPGIERAAVMIKRLVPAASFELFYRKYYKLP